MNLNEVRSHIDRHKVSVRRGDYRSDPIQFDTFDHTITYKPQKKTLVS